MDKENAITLLKAIHIDKSHYDYEHTQYAVWTVPREIVEDMDEALDMAIKSLEAFDEKKIHAKWYVCEEQMAYACSECGFYNQNNLYKFCPRCGCQMDK